MFFPVTAGQAVAVADLRDPTTEARDLTGAGVSEMIKAGHHREVMAYPAQVSLVALYVIDINGSESMKVGAREAYRRFMICYGIGNEEDHRVRIAKMRDALRELKATTERIIQANPHAID